MSSLLHTETYIEVSPPTSIATLEQRGVGFDWMITNLERSTPTNAARGILAPRWHTGKGVVKLYHVSEPVPFLCAIHTHRQVPTFEGARNLGLRDAPARLGGAFIDDFDQPLPAGGFLFRGAGHRWGLWDIPCVSSGPPDSPATPLGASIEGVENFTIRLLPVLQYEQGWFSLRVNLNQRHYFWWTQQPGATGAESSYGFHAYTDYTTDTGKQIVPAGHLPRRALGDWLQFNFLTFDEDTLAIEILDHEGAALERFLAYDPTLVLESKGIEIELYVQSGLMALGVTEHIYTATAPPPESIADEDPGNDPDDVADGLALTYPLNASVYVTNTNTPTGRALGHTPTGTSMTVYAQGRSGSDLKRPVVALTATETRTPVLVGAQLSWPTTLTTSDEPRTPIEGIRSAPVASYAKDYRSNHFSVEYALGEQALLKGNERIEVRVINYYDDGSVCEERPLFAGFVSGFGTHVDERDQEVVARLEARDWTLRLEKKDMADTPAFGGWALRDAVEFVAERCGLPTDLLHWEASPDDWQIPQRAPFKLELKFDETATAVEALDALLLSCGFTWGTGFDGHVHIWRLSAMYADAGVTIDDRDTAGDPERIVHLTTHRDLDGFANEILLLTSPLPAKGEPTMARVGNPDSKHDPDHDQYIGEEWTRAIRYDDSFPASLIGWLELERHTRDRRLLRFRPRHGRLDIIPRSVVTANVSGHDFAFGARFGVVRAIYAVADVGGLPRLTSQFVLAAMRET